VKPVASPPDDADARPRFIDAAGAELGGGVGTLSDPCAKADRAGAGLAAWSLVQGVSLLWLNDAINAETARGTHRADSVRRLDPAGWGHLRLTGRAKRPGELRRQCWDRGLAGHVRRGLLGQERGGDQRGERETHGYDEHHRVGV
jgi:hypothetical protein